MRAAKLAAVLTLSLCVTAPVHAATEEELKELGIEMQGGSATAAEQIAKAKEIGEKYERAKARVAAAFGGAPVEEAEAPEEAGEREALPPAPVVVKPKKKPVQTQESLSMGSGPLNNLVRLRNGQELADVRVEKAENGYWIEIDGGKMFFDKSEVIEIKKRQD